MLVIMSHREHRWIALDLVSHDILSKNFVLQCMGHPKLHFIKIGPYYFYLVCREHCIVLMSAQTFLTLKSFFSCCNIHIAKDKDGDRQSATGQIDGVIFATCHICFELKYRFRNTQFYVAKLLHIHGELFFYRKIRDFSAFFASKM